MAERGRRRARRRTDRRLAGSASRLTRVRRLPEDAQHRDSFERHGHRSLLVRLRVALKSLSCRPVSWLGGYERRLDRGRCLTIAERTVRLAWRPSSLPAPRGFRAMAGRRRRRRSGACSSAGVGEVTLARCSAGAVALSTGLASIHTINGRRSPVADARSSCDG